MKIKHIKDFEYTCKFIESNDILLTVPKSINDKYINVFTGRQLQHSEPVYYSKLSNIRVSCFDKGIGGTAIKTDDGFYIDGVTSYWSEGCFESKSLIHDLYVDKGILLAQKWGGYNYFHYLFTVLPGYYVVRSAIRNIKDYTFIVNEYYKRRFIKESLDLLGIRCGEQNIIELSFNPVIKCEELHVASLTGYGVNPNKNTCKFLRELFKDYIVVPSKRKRLYITRKGYRKITNEQDVFKVLHTYGFEYVDPEQLSFLEQILLFSQAEVVVSPHGAGLSNIVWCNSGTKVLELFSPTYVGLCYWLLGDSCGHDLYYLVGDGQSVDDDKYWYSNGKSDMIINTFELAQTLKMMEIC